ALWLPLPLDEPFDEAALRARIQAALDAYTAACRRRFEAHYDPTLLRPEEAAQVSDLPRVILVPGLGMWTSGKDLRAATIAADIYHHTLSIMTAAQALGGYASLNEHDAFHAEYWPLELYKLTLAPPEKELARRVALVTGAGHGIGRAIALRLAAEGAHVVVTDIDEAAACEVAETIVRQYGFGRALALHMDVTDEASVQRAFEQTCLTYGGLDILVSNAGIARAAAIADLTLEDWQRSLAVNATGHFLVSRAAFRLMRAQGIGGSLVFNATKNVTAPGKEFGAYSAAKAAEAQLCRILAIEGGEHGIRANMVNPDAVFSTNLWSPELRRQRAQAQGIREDEIEDFYAKRNLLRARVTAEDVAEAVFWLASDRSAKTTGAMIPVDGGVREAFPR
ncbi:MAG: SDR family oxidoreductase, partial [Thermoflexales bacterium]|nr:SDR family oxidoreductase [Thermoflexales bacterium]